jgi:hypothetical protein
MKAFVARPTCSRACVAQGQNPSRDNPHFWEELLLLKVNAVFLETCVKDTTEDQLLVLKVPCL